MPSSSDIKAQLRTRLLRARRSLTDDKRAEWTTALREQLERRVREELGAEKERHAHTLTTLDVSTPRIRKFQVPSPSSELPERVTGSPMDRETDTKITHEKLPPKTSSAPQNTQSPPQLTRSSDNDPLLQHNRRT